jgi:hypothetical protein
MAETRTGQTGLVRSDKLVSLLHELKYSEDYARPYHQRAKDWYKLSRQFLTEPGWPYINQIHTPDTFAFVEDAAAKIYNTLYGTMPFLTWKPRKGFLDVDSGGPKVATALEDVTNWMIESNTEQFSMEGYAYTKNKCIYGTGHLGVFPKFDTFRGEETVVGANFVSADYWDLLPNPNDWMGGRHATWQWYREFMTKDAVKDLFDRGVFKGNFKDVPEVGSAYDDPEKNWHTKLLHQLGWERWVPAPEDEDLWEVFHRYEDGHIITIINRGYVARDTKQTLPNGETALPYNVPFIDSKYTIFDKEYFGVGIPEIIESLQRDKNLIRSQHRDNIDLVLNAIVKVSRDGDVDLSTIEHFPGAIWLADRVEDVVREEITDVTSSQVLSIENKIELDMDRGVGSSRFSRGEQPMHSRETATAVVRLQQASATRLDTQIRLTESAGVRGMGWQLGLLAQQELNDEIFEKIAGATKEEVFGPDNDESEWDLRFKVDAFPLGSSITAVKELQAQQMTQILEIMSQMDPQRLQLGQDKRSLEMGTVLENTFISMGLTREEAQKLIPKVGPEGQGALTPANAPNQEDLGQIEAALREEAARPV